jgi:hypothetical protein
MGIGFRWSALGIHTWLPTFFLYVNDVPNVISDIGNAVLYADDTSLIITNSVSQMFEKVINTDLL